MASLTAEDIKILQEIRQDLVCSDDHMVPITIPYFLIKTQVQLLRDEADALEQRDDRIRKFHELLARLAASEQACEAPKSASQNSINGDTSGTSSFRIVDSFTE